MRTQKKCVLIITLVTLLFMQGCGNSEEEIVTNGDSIEISAIEITSKAKFYSFSSDGIKINYFAVKGSDGEIRTAFDACDVCGGRKGYRQRGNDVVCNNCGRYFNIDHLGTRNKGGGCWPSYLSHEIKDDKLIIQKQELAKGRRFF